MEPKDWYLKLQGLTTGPLPTRELHEWIRRRWLTSDVEIFDGASKSWKKLSDLSSFAEFFASDSAGAAILTLEAERYVEPPSKPGISSREKKIRIQQTPIPSAFHSDSNADARAVWPGIRPSLRGLLRAEELTPPPAKQFVHAKGSGNESLPTRPQELSSSLARQGTSAVSAAPESTLVALVDDLLRFEAQQISKETLQVPRKAQEQGPANEAASATRTSAKPKVVPEPPRPLTRPEEPVAKGNEFPAKDQARVFAELQQELANTEALYWRRSVQQGWRQGVSWPTVIAVTVVVTTAVYGKPFVKVVYSGWSTMPEKALPSAPAVANSSNDSKGTVPEQSVAAASKVSDMVIRDGEILQRAGSLERDTLQATSKEHTKEPEPRLAPPSLRAPSRPKRD